MCKSYAIIKRISLSSGLSTTNFDKSADDGKTLYRRVGNRIEMRISERTGKTVFFQYFPICKLTICKLTVFAKVLIPFIKIKLDMKINLRISFTTSNFFLLRRNMLQFMIVCYSDIVVNGTLFCPVIAVKDIVYCPVISVYGSPVC